jgi:hypothetical protein
MKSDVLPSREKPGRAAAVAVGSVIPLALIIGLDRRLLCASFVSSSGVKEVTSRTGL